MKPSVFDIDQAASDICCYFNVAQGDNEFDEAFSEVRQIILPLLVSRKDHQQLLKYSAVALSMLKQMNMLEDNNFLERAIAKAEVQHD